ncbi:MAG: flagellin, partial [Rhodocyclales bacterium]|nr:flagellin [Rhodocyclales bacterium]
MAQTINTNVASLFGQQALNKSSQGLQTAMQRLSSGVRINSARDDATGMSTASGFESKMRGANMALRAANEGIAKAQINDGYHAQVYENLQRMREIAVQKAGTASGDEYTSLKAENTRLLGLAAATGAVVVKSDGSTVTGAATAVASISGNATVSDIDNDITLVVAARSKYGADMATFSSAAGALGTEAVNSAAQYSAVMDTDYAVETTN